MALDLSTVLGTAATETAPVPEAPAEEVGIPDVVLEIPAIAALLQGTPPAVWALRDDPSPEVQTIVENKDALLDAGFGFFGSSDGQTVAFFNQQFVEPEVLQAADSKGKLREFATSFEELKSSLAPAGAPEAPSAPAAPSMASASPGAGFDRKLATKRLKNLAVGAPTSGPSPGQGRILNSLMSPTV